MNKKIIKYLIWTILITAVLVLIPTNKAMAVTVKYSDFKISENLFCLNHGDPFGIEEEYSSEKIEDGIFTFIGSSQTVDIDVLKYIMTEANTNSQYANRTDVGGYIPQEAIWKLATPTYSVGSDVTALINKAYAYNKFLDLNVVNEPKAEREDSNTFAVYYTKTSYNGETFSNLISVDGTGFNKTPIEDKKLTNTSNGYTHKRIYEKNPGTASCTVTIKYETGRTADLFLYEPTRTINSRIQEYYYEYGNEQIKIFKIVVTGNNKSIRCMYDTCDGWMENITLDPSGYYDDTTHIGGGFTGSLDSAIHYLRLYGGFSNLGCDEFFRCSANEDHPIIAYYDDLEYSNYYAILDDPTDHIDGKYIIIDFWGEFGYSLTPSQIVNSTDYPQNLLYGDGSRVTTETTGETKITFGLNVTINKTDSLTNAGLSGAKFKVNLTNVSAIGNYQLPTQGAQQNSPTTVYVTTDNNGQIKLSGIIPTSTSQNIEITIEETAVPTANGWYYKKLENPITTTLEYKSGTWKFKSGSGTFSENTLTVDIENTPYINIGGMVWEDVQIGEKGNIVGPNGERDAVEKGLEGVYVRLYSVKDDKTILSTYTEADGSYSFAEIPRTQEGYRIIFNYDGIHWQETKSLGTKGTDSKIEKTPMDRYEYYREVDKTTRDDFNNVFKTISKGTATSEDGEINIPLAYDYKDGVSTLKVNMDGTNPANSNNHNFQMRARTAVYNTTQVNLDCGLVKKTFDLSIGTDVKSAKLTINDKTTEYTYAQIMNGELDFQDNSANKADVIYNLYLYSSDYNYRIGDYKTDVGGNNVPDSDNDGIADYEKIENLEAFVTYSVILKSQTTEAVTESSTVEQFVYYYDDTVYLPEFSVNDVLNGYKVKSIEGNKITFESADSKNELSKANDYRKEIDLTFKIKKNADGNLIVKENATNIVEITKYSTSKGGLIDKDSAPENGITNGTITSYEDDTDQAKGLNIVLRTNETRTIEGTVFEDTKTGDSLKYNGQKDDSEQGVNDVIVQLIEIKKIGGVYYEYIWQETRSGSNVVKKLSEDGNTIEEITYRETAPNDGSYVFADFIPGNYIIRYIYGDGTTYNLTDNVKTYNGQDYKSTIDPNYNKAWYNTAGYTQGQSVARDNEARRLEVMAYSTTVNATNGEALTNKTDEALQNTWMCAETSRINIPVDADDKATDQNSTTASYNYTKNDTKVQFGDMNFGLALRPETNIVLEKHITALKITPSGTGVQPIIDAKVKDLKDSDGEVIEVAIQRIVNGTEEEGIEVEGVTTGLATIKSTAANRGFWQVATDVEELMQGAELEVEYTYVLRNDSEEDYLNKNVITEYCENIAKDVNNNGTDDYAEYLQGASDAVDTTIKNGTYSYSNSNRIGTYLGEFYYTGDKGTNDELVSSRVETFEEALNNDLAFDESQATSFKVTEQGVTKNVYGVNNAEGTKETEINTVVQNTTVSTFLTPKLEEKHTTATADWSRRMTLTTTLATVSGGELGANLPSYIAEIVEYSNAAGRKDMTATPANLGYVHSDDTEMTMEKDNEQDEFWAESIIITKPTGEDKLTPIQIVIITISAVALLGVGVVLIKKFVLKK